jgi:peptidyl-tRNA hydrolase
MAQTVHAAFAYARDHPDATRDWLLRSNYLVVVSVPDEARLLDLISEAARRAVTRCAVREPDLDDSVTAVVLGPGPGARKLCANLPCALRTRERTNMGPTCENRPSDQQQRIPPERTLAVP